MRRGRFGTLAAAACFLFGSTMAVGGGLPASPPTAPVGSARPELGAAAEQSIYSSLDLRFATKGEAPTGANAEARARDFIRSRMGQDDFYFSVLPSLFHTMSTAVQIVPRTLTKKKIGNEDIYYLSGKKPCARSGAVLVRPWWALSTKILVCKEAYRPEVKSELGHGTTQYCERMAYNGDHDTCACGEYLLSCGTDELTPKLSDESQLEVLRTVRAFVRAREPFSRILTTKETLRSGLGDFFYARSAFFATGDVAELEKVDVAAPPTMRPRRPEFSAGLLTTPAFLYFDDARRIVITTLWDDFLCIPLLSARVDTRHMLAATDGKLRGQDNFGLTTTLGCKDCHARLENAMRSFRGFTMGHVGERFVSNAVFTGEVAFHVGGADDRRATGPAAPEWLGATMAKQPEFGQCMVRRVEDLVFGGERVPVSGHDELQVRFQKTQDFAQLIEDAIVLRVTGRATSATR